MVIDPLAFSPKILAQRIVSGVGARRGELILVRDEAGRMDVTLAVMLQIELAGATPLLQYGPTDHLCRVWNQAPLAYLSQWDTHRTAWVEQADRIVVLKEGDWPVLSVPEERYEAWESAEHRLNTVEEQQPRPYLIAAVPTEQGARQLGMTLETLELMLNGALTVPLLDIQREIQQVLGRLRGQRQIEIVTGPAEEHRLMVSLGDRPWRIDDGYIDAEDAAAETWLAHIPAGLLYTTVVETETEGSLFVPNLIGIRNVTLRFEAGEIVEVNAPVAGRVLERLLEQHTVDARRISHIGVGLNPKLRRRLGWTFVDEHAHGCYVAGIGNNAYFGGQNRSDLTLPFQLGDAHWRVDGERFKI